MRRRTRKKKPDLFEIQVQPMDEESKKLFKMFPNIRTFVYGDCQVSVGRTSDFGYYLQVASNKRWPTLQEVMDVRSKLVPGNIDMGLIIPAQAHPGVFVLHAYQVQKPKFLPVYDPKGRMLGKEQIQHSPPED